MSFHLHIVFQHFNHLCELLNVNSQETFFKKKKQLRQLIRLQKLHELKFTIHALKAYVTTALRVHQINSPHQNCHTEYKPIELGIC